MLILSFFKSLRVMKDNLKILLIIGILFLSMIGFVRCYNFELINLDDYLYLTMHDYVREWQGIASIKDFLQMSRKAFGCL